MMDHVPENDGFCAQKCADSKTATVHSKCKKGQADGISKIHERMYESSHRQHETYEAKQTEKQREEVKMMNFVLKNDEFVLKMMHFALKMMNFVL